MTNEPRQALERLLASVAGRRWDELPDLYADDAVVLHPFALPSPTRLEGRAAVAAHFRRVSQFPIRMRADHLIVHRTDDLEVIVAEFDYVGENTATKRRFSVRNVFVLRVRQGRIVESRDYVNHAAFARLLDDELLPIPQDGRATPNSPTSAGVGQSPRPSPAPEKSSTMRYTTTLQARTKNATVIEVPEDVLTSLGSVKRPAVRVTINGHSYRSRVGIMDGTFLVPVSADVRTQAGIAAGDEIEVDLELDSEPREVKVPADVAEALEAGAGARSAFDALSEGRKRQHVALIEGAKTPETRERRIAKLVADLSGP